MQLLNLKKGNVCTAHAALHEQVSLNIEKGWRAAVDRTPSTNIMKGKSNNIYCYGCKCTHRSHGSLLKAEFTNWTARKCRLDSIWKNYNYDQQLKSTLWPKHKGYGYMDPSLENTNKEVSILNGQ